MNQHLRSTFWLVSLGVCLVSCYPSLPSNTRARSDFAIQFKFVDGELNTFDGYIVKDLVSDGSARADFQISPSEVEAIKTKLEEVHFFELASPYPTSERLRGHINSLRVVWGTRSNYIEWEIGRGRGGKLEMGLHELELLISSIAYNSFAWKSLLAARGARR